MKTNPLITDATRNSVFETRTKIESANTEIHNIEKGINLLNSARDLTQEEQIKAHRYIEGLKSRRNELLSERVQFMTSKAEKLGIKLLANECDLTISEFLRAYFRTLNPKSVKLLRLTLDKMQAQQQIIATLIDSNNYGSQQARDSLARLETLTVVAVTLLEERT